MLERVSKLSRSVSAYEGTKRISKSGKEYANNRRFLIKKWLERITLHQRESAFTVLDKLGIEVYEGNKLLPNLQRLYNK